MHFSAFGTTGNNFVSSACEIKRKKSEAYCISLMYNISNNKGPSMDPCNCGTPIFVLIILDFLSFISTSCLQFVNNYKTIMKRSPIVHTISILR